jgi:hypothetical protein
VVGRLAILLALGSTLAHANPQRIAAARDAITEVRYEDARRLLADALAAGDNGPAELAELYALSARTAIVFDERDVAEQFYRRWLELDPAAALPANSPPKLRELFDAARAFVEAHGALVAHATRRPEGVAVEVVADPLTMIHAVRLPSGAAIDLADRRATVPGDAAKVELVDDHGNLVATIGVLDPPHHLTEPVWPRRWTTWAVTAGTLGAVSLGFGVATLVYQRSAADIVAHSADHARGDADAEVSHARKTAVLAGITGALALGAVVPAIVLHRRARVAPVIDQDRVGIAIAGSF